MAQHLGKGKFVAFNKDLSITHFIEEATEQFPDNIAVRFANFFLTYAELNQHVNKLANYLVSIWKIPPQKKIAIYLPPGIEMIVSILAVLKIGCSYIPIDVTYPIERINFMLKDSGSNYLIVNSPMGDALYFEGIKIFLEEDQEVIGEQPTHFTKLDHGNDIAYIIYTSGSTGVPKGVVISHSAVNNHMLWLKKCYAFDRSDKILLKTPISFDPSVWEIFLPFYIGCEMVIAPQGAHIDPHLLIELITKYTITTIQLVPSLLEELLKHKHIKECQSLKRVFVGGESLRIEIKKAFFTNMSCKLINLYGPAEATIDITSHTVTSTPFNINNDIIGSPIFNTSLYVVNAQFNLASIGEEGELYIGSDSLAQGYYNRDELTKENFLDNPFEPQRFPKIYKTGDVVRWITKSKLEYLGRNNDQVKVNGVRVEPKELISVILECEEVSDCIVVKKTSSYKVDYLACYLIQQPRKKLNLFNLKENLKQKFPTYMLPKVFIFLDKFPLTVNGKINVELLPEPDFSKPLCSFDEHKDLQPVELKLLQIWQDILETNQITLHDNFFDAGGGSLLALKLISAIHKEFDISVRIRDIFSYPTLKEQVYLIKNYKNNSSLGDYNLLPNVIIPLQNNLKGTPLFLIHPIGGTVFWYLEFAKLLGGFRPVYGIQDPSIDLEKPVFDSIEEIASFYLTQIRTIQPNGPYLIGGASFGTTIAVELANILKRDSENVAAIISLDGWGVYPHTLQDDNYFKSSMLRQHNDYLADFVKYNLPPPDTLFDIQWHRLGLLWKYQLTHVGSPLVLFKSEEILPAFLEIDDQFNHWKKFCELPVQVYTVPGNHETMFQEPHVFALANILNNYLLKENF